MRTPILSSRILRRSAMTIGLLAAAMLSPSPATFAAADPPSPLLDRYAFTLGSYFTAVDTDVTADEDLQQRGTNVDFESDLDFKNSDELFRVEAQVLLKPRHQLNFGYYELNRSASNVIQREIEWRDRVFPVNVDLAGFFDTQVLEISYTWWWVAKEKVVFGVNAGVQQIGMDIGLDLSPQGSPRSIGADVGFEQFVPLVGLELRRSLTDKLMFRGLGRVVSISNVGDLRKATVTDFAAGFEYRFLANGGIGVAYKLLNFDLDIERRLVSGSVDYRLDGVEAFLRFGF